MTLNNHLVRQASYIASFLAAAFCAAVFYSTVIGIYPPPFKIVDQTAVGWVSPDHESITVMMTRTTDANREISVWMDRMAVCQYKGVRYFYDPPPARRDTELGVIKGYGAMKIFLDVGPGAKCTIYTSFRYALQPLSMAWQKIDAPDLTFTVLEKQPEHIDGVPPSN